MRVTIDVFQMLQCTENERLHIDMNNYRAQKFDPYQDKWELLFTKKVLFIIFIKNIMLVYLH